MNNIFKEKFPKLYDDNGERYRLEPVYDGGDCGSIYKDNGVNINKKIFEMQIENIKSKRLTKEELDCVQIRKEKTLKKVL